MFPISTIHPIQHKCGLQSSRGKMKVKLLTKFDLTDLFYVLFDNTIASLYTLPVWP